MPGDPERVEHSAMVLKIVGAVLSAVVVGAITQGVLLYTQNQLTIASLTRIQADVDDLKIDVKKSTEDRIKKATHNEDVDKILKRVDSLAAQVQGVVTEQARRSAAVWRIDQIASDMASIRADVDALRRSQRDHAAEESHPKAEKALDGIARAAEALTRRVADLEKR